MDMEFLYPSAADWQPPSFVLDLYESVDAIYPIKVNMYDFFSGKIDPRLQRSISEVCIVFIIFISAPYWDWGPFILCYPFLILGGGDGAPHHIKVIYAYM